jgi:hypothetical protein
MLHRITGASTNMCIRLCGFTCAHRTYRLLLLLSSHHKKRSVGGWTSGVGGGAGFHFCLDPKTRLQNTVFASPWLSWHALLCTLEKCHNWCICNANKGYAIASSFPSPILFRIAIRVSPPPSSPPPTLSSFPTCLCYLMSLLLFVSLRSLTKCFDFDELKFLRPPHPLLLYHPHLLPLTTY